MARSSPRGAARSPRRRARRRHWLEAAGRWRADGAAALATPSQSRPTGAHRTALALCSAHLICKNVRACAVNFPRVRAIKLREGELLGRSKFEQAACQ
jgi:hypothetical protein